MLVLAMSCFYLLGMQPVNAEVDNSIYDTCVQESGTINNGVVAACSNFASEAYKKNITTDYRIIYAALKKTNPDDAKKLEDAQIAWIEYRDKHCELAGGYIGSPMYAYCPMQLNLDRALQLSQMSESF